VINSLIFGAIARIARRQKPKFLAQTTQVTQRQTEFLQTLLQAHQSTEFGQRYQFATLATVTDFRDRVPIHRYTDLDPYFQRMANGESNILTAEPPIYFNITSGSTGYRKLIPVTRQSRRQVAKTTQASMGFVADAALRQGLPFGPLLFPASVNAVGKTSSGVDYAPVSNSDMRLTNPIYRVIFSSPPAAHQIADLASRHYVCLLFALRDRNLRIFAETFPVLVLRLCGYLERYASDLIADLQQGTLADWLTIDPEVRSHLERLNSPRPKRADELAKILAREGHLRPKDVWPKLSFIITARGGTSDFYFERFPDYFGSVPVFGGTYASAEATYGIHRDFNTDGVLLALEAGFFEFIPEDQWEVDQPKTLLPTELTVGDRYRIVVTNYNGFYRYDVGDVVEVEGFHNQTPLLIFRHRYGGFITCVGEKTTEDHITQTINALQRTHDLRLENVCVTLTDEIPPRYVVNIELAAGQTLAAPEKFLWAFDEELKAVHVMYELKRRDQVAPPILRVLAPGSFDQLRQRLVQGGTVENQIKLPKISNDRQFLRDLPIQYEVQAPT
jgi:hypothetical protein